MAICYDLFYKLYYSSIQNFQVIQLLRRILINRCRNIWSSARHKADASKSGDRRGRRPHRTSCQGDRRPELAACQKPSRAVSHPGNSGPHAARFSLVTSCLHAGLTPPGSLRTPGLSPDTSARHGHEKGSGPERLTASGVPCLPGLREHGPDAIELTVPGLNFRPPYMTKPTALPGRGPGPTRGTTRPPRKHGLRAAGAGKRAKQTAPGMMPERGGAWRAARPQGNGSP